MSYQKSLRANALVIFILLALITVLIVAIAFFVHVEVASAATINVPADQPTIQAAVNAAVNGDIINVSAGTYDEQVVIDAKNVTLQGTGNATILQPTSAAILSALYTYPVGVLPGWNGLNLAGVILVKNAGSVTVQDLLIDGTNVTSLTPTIAISGVSVAPASGASQSFTSPVAYTVTAADSSTQTYVVTVTVLP